MGTDHERRMATGMRVLVTGGAGYIGSVIVAELIAAGHAVTVLDSLEYGHRAALDPAARLVVGRVQDGGLVAATLRADGIEAVIHMAAYIAAGESVAQPVRYLSNNVGGSLSVVGAMVEAGVRRIVFSSTASLYGETDGRPIREDAPLDPPNPYAESKLMVERLLHWAAAAHGLTATALRYFNAAGATARCGEDHQPETHLIPLVLAAARSGATLRINGTDYPTPDGTCVRDYIHVVDLAQAHVLALGRAAPGLKIYNVGTGLGVSVRQVIAAARQVTGQPLPTEENARRPGDQAATVADADRIRAELGWQPRFPELTDILGSAWRWHQAHPDGYPANA